MFCRLFGESFPNLSSVDLEGVLSMMSKHPQYGCVSQIKEQLASDGPVRYRRDKKCATKRLINWLTEGLMNFLVALSHLDNLEHFGLEVPLILS